MGWTSLVRTMLAQQPHWASMAVLQWASMGAPAATEDDGGGDGAAAAGAGAEEAEEGEEGEEEEEEEEGEEEEEAEWQSFAGEEGEEDDREGDDDEDEEEGEGEGVVVVLPEALAPTRGGSNAATAPKSVVGAADDAGDYDADAVLSL